MRLEGVGGVWWDTPPRAISSAVPTPCGVGTSKPPFAATPIFAKFSPPFSQEGALSAVQVFGRLAGVVWPYHPPPP